MEQNRPFTAGEGGDSHSSAEGNPPWKKDKRQFSLSEFIEKRWKLIIGVCVLLIVLALILMPEDKDKTASQDTQKPFEGAISVLSSRLDKIESRISGLEHAFASSDQNTNKDRQDQFEADMTLKVDQMSKKLEDLYAASASSETRKSEIRKSEPVRKVESETPKQPAAVQKKSDPPKQSPAHIHKVEKGDTVFSISRKYKVKVEDIYRANNLTSSSVIQPGQKLTIHPPKSN